MNLPHPIFSHANKAREHLEALHWPRGPVAALALSCVVTASSNTESRRCMARAMRYRTKAVLGCRLTAREAAEPAKLRPIVESFCQLHV
jgi:hypothetical protein